MSTQKRQPGSAKSKTAASAATELIPPEIRELLGPSPVVDIAEQPIFERILAGAVSELRPSGMIEWTLVHDFVVTTWEIRQLREYKTSFLQIENVKYCKYQEKKFSDKEAEKWAKDQINYVRDAENPELTKYQNYEYFHDRLMESMEKLKSMQKAPDSKKFENLSVGETKYNRAFRLSEVISKQADTIEHLQKMTLMLEKRRDALLRDLDRRQAARRERDSAHPHHNRDATDIETRVEG